MYTIPKALSNTNIYVCRKISTSVDEFKASYTGMEVESSSSLDSLHNIHLS
uniref:Uncharacterized protein n=1 Tax=Solanum tuberosum TaxID=4113 RepID=M1BUD5_SOLTU